MARMLAPMLQLDRVGVGRHQLSGPRLTVVPGPCAARRACDTWLDVGAQPIPLLVPVPFLRQPAAMSSSTQTLPPVRPPRLAAEDRYRLALQAIAAGRPGTGRTMTGNEAQQLARRVLVEIGDDWTKRAVETEQSAPLESG